jgi:exonuclease SbcC
MSEDRFTFSEDFRIVDGHTRQPRDEEALSGGETFLASLALASTLVELTYRGGGRVEALFLDEKFGSLDTNVLGKLSKRSPSGHRRPVGGGGQPYACRGGELR